MAKVNCPVELKRFGSVIREARERLEETQDSFAGLCGLHRTYIGQVERGEKNISFENILKIARVLKLSPSALFDRADL